MMRSLDRLGRYLSLLEESYENFLEAMEEAACQALRESTLPGRFLFLPDEEGRDFRTDGGRKIPVLEIGYPEHRRNTLVFEATCHGGEKVHSLTLFLAFLALCREEAELANGAYSIFLPVIDPDGWHKETRAYVDRSGEEVRTPVVVSVGHIRNFFGWEDANAAFGRKTEVLRGRRIRALQRYLLSQPGVIRVYSSLHETVTMESEYVYRNAGIMIFIHERIPFEEHERLARLRYPLALHEKLEFLLRLRLPFLSPKYRGEVLFRYPSVRKTLYIRNFIRKSGLPTFQDAFEAAFREIPFFLERDLPVFEGIYLVGPIFRRAGIALAPDFFQYYTGCTGRTIETFAQRRELRILQGLAFVEGTLRVEVKGEQF
ncbi:MAG: hypothetical protein H5U36_03235 [Candidatus Caldatribacterium sp.]|nr:hypothetical protein [Candidatus Caldatribacterium sp.]